MALKVGGTIVVNDSRGLENISNIKTINGNAVLGTGDISIPTYTHPANHPASIITQDENNRFVTDAEKTAWNAKIGTVKTINGQSIVGSGDLAVTGSSAFATDITVNGLRLGRGTNINAYFNTFFGEEALLTSSGSNNTAVGWSALKSNTNGSSNTAYGSSSLSSNTQGLCNVAIGNSVLNSNITGSYNTASGQSAMLYNETGQNNAAFGAYALLNNTNGQHNTACGNGALRANTTGSQNTASGSTALEMNTTGVQNTACGAGALSRNSTGNGNTVIGSQFLTSGAYAPVFNVTTENNRVAMGHTSVTNAYIQVAWTVVSDARDKTNFASIPHGLEFVKQLKPTAYQFRESRESEATNGGVRYGFKAQDIAAIEPEAVIVDTTNPDKLYYNESNLVPVLVKAIQELSAEVERLKAKAE